jgi:hypothetical protein
LSAGLGGQPRRLEDMLAIAQDAKLVFYLLIFIGLATSLLLTGAEVVETGARNVAVAISHNPTGRGDFWSALLATLRIGSVVLTSVFSIYAIAEMKHLIVITKIISDNIYILISAWLIVSIVISIFMLIIRRLKASVYTLLFVDYTMVLWDFILSCIRLQWQILIVILPWIAIKEWYVLKDFVAEEPARAGLMLAGYIWLLALTFVVAVIRIRNGKLLYDFCCAVCLIAFGLLVLNNVDNEGTSIFINVD